MTRNYYRVPAKREDGGVTADVPDGVSWVGNTDGNTYLILTPVELPPQVGRERQLPDQQVIATARALGLRDRDPLDRWHIRGV